MTRRQIRRKNLGPATAQAEGREVVLLKAVGSPGRRLGERIGHKWIGWTRLRKNPELVNL
jgi:hypothetical protein